MASKDVKDAKPEVGTQSGAGATKKRDKVDGLEIVPPKLNFDRYNFKHARRGMAVIINNEHFNYRLTRQQEREGTEVDADALERSFVRLGFDVTRHDDMTVTDMRMTLRQIATDDHSDADCFVLVILSHGEEGEVYGTNGKVKVDYITSLFKGDEAPSLAGKPKLFFIQACRGRRYDWGVDVEVADGDEDEADAGPPIVTDVRRIPVEADFLLAYSVTSGHFSWRNNVDGSWFIQALVRVLEEHGQTAELMHMMTVVNRVVAYYYESITDDDFTSGMKQVPSISSTLTKLVYFTPKY